MSLRTTIAHNLKLVMHDRAISVGELAAMLFTTDYVALDWLSGESLPCPDQMQRLCGILGIHTDVLFQRPSEHTSTISQVELIFKALKHYQGAAKKVAQKL
tara:strand:- start:5575 stop:5877 length:303 start_codon:yes stop_codon:yes gene_type:complete